ncbi:transcription factor TFIIF complex subunit Tfg3 [Coemansia sp. RSA 1933]|nr:transcription factor TFIIF complex subunit Tfg3 [Coemansia sp. RSA 1933]
METEVVLAIHTQHQETGRTVVSGGIEYSLRTWSCTLQEGRSRIAGSSTLLPYVHKVEFIMHETFDNPHKVVSHAPFRVEEEGWGEFDLVVVVYLAHCSDSYRIIHDLSFHEGESYTKRYSFSVPAPSPAFLALFNKPAPFSRKTIPARATKARKGPPRDSAYANSTSQPTHGSSDLSSDGSDLTDSLSGSDDSSANQTSRQRDREEDADGRSTTTIAYRQPSKDAVLMRTPKPRSAQPGTGPQRSATTLPRHRRSPPASSAKSASASHSGVKRRLSDVNATSATPTGPPNTTTMRRTTGGKHASNGESRILSISPPLQQEAATEGHADQPKHTMASAIASMRVPKKQALAPKASSSSSSSTLAVLADASGVSSQTSSAASSREAFIRERERQRRMDQEADKNDALSNDTPVRRRPHKRDADDTPTPRQRQQQQQSSRAIADYSPKRSRTETDDDDSGSDTFRLSPRLARRIECIIEYASLLSDTQIVGFLRLLHILRIQQDPEAAQEITAHAVDRVMNSGEYSCSLSNLPPAAIDKLWTFVRDTRA